MFISWNYCPVIPPSYYETQNSFILGLKIMKHMNHHHSHFILNADLSYGTQRAMTEEGDEGNHAFA